LRAKELCETKAIERYRKLRQALVAADAQGSADARTEEPTCPLVIRSGRARNIPAGDALDALGVHRSLPVHLLRTKIP
jgi:hypothetical protein